MLIRSKFSLVTCACHPFFCAYTDPVWVFRVVASSRNRPRVARPTLWRFLSLRLTEILKPDQSRGCLKGTGCWIRVKEPAMWEDWLLSTVLSCPGKRNRSNFLFKLQALYSFSWVCLFWIPRHSFLQNGVSTSNWATSYKKAPLLQSVTGTKVGISNGLSSIFFFYHLAKKTTD